MAKNVACGAPRLCFSSDKQGRVFWSFRSTDVAGGSPASSETAVNLTQFLVLGNQRGMRIESALVERKVRVSICFRLQKKRLILCQIKGEVNGIWPGFEWFMAHFRSLWG